MIVLHWFIKIWLFFMLSFSSPEHKSDQNKPFWSVFVRRPFVNNYWAKFNDTGIVLGDHLHKYNKAWLTTNNKMADLPFCFINICAETTRQNSITLYRKLHYMTVHKVTSRHWNLLTTTTKCRTLSYSIKLHKKLLCVTHTKYKGRDWSTTTKWPTFCYA